MRKIEAEWPLGLNDCDRGNASTHGNRRAQVSSTRPAAFVRGCASWKIQPTPGGNLVACKRTRRARLPNAPKISRSNRPVLQNYWSETPVRFLSFFFVTLTAAI